MPPWTIAEPPAYVWVEAGRGDALPPWLQLRGDLDASVEACERLMAYGAQIRGWLRHALDLYDRLA